MRRIIPILLIFLSVIYLSGCDAMYRLLQKEGAEEKDLIGESVPFESNPTIEEIQKLLSIYGYAPGKIDGAIGARTRIAIERFQKDNSLEPTRFVDAATWQKLKIFKDTPFIVKNEINLKYVQMILKQAGYNVGVVDGRTGERTKQAILDFQKAHKLKTDGRIGYQTLIKLSLYVLKDK